MQRLSDYINYLDYQESYILHNLQMVIGRLSSVSEYTYVVPYYKHIHQVTCKSSIRNKHYTHAALLVSPEKKTVV